MKDFYCPFCNTKMLEHNSTMWTGMSNQILMYKLECVQQNHFFQVKAGTEEDLIKIMEKK